MQQMADVGGVVEMGSPATMSRTENMSRRDLGGGLQNGLMPGKNAHHVQAAR
jgi:hypothetical protein